MAGAEHPSGTGPVRRRFVTRVDVEAAARAGDGVDLGPLDVITHEAAQRARDLGVAVTRPERTAPPRATGSSLAPLVADPVPGHASGGRERRPPEADRARLRDAVRTALVAELGGEPAGLDAAIDTVLARREQ
jgi:hypothetical protein